MTQDATLHLIRFVTGRQRDLRGLREVAYATCIIATMTVIALAPRESGASVGRLMPWLLGVLVLGGLLPEVVLRLVERWYNGQYGRVEPRALHSASTQPLLALGAVLDIYWPYPIAGHSAFPIVLAVHGAWIAARDLPWRTYYLLAIPFAIWAPGVDEPSRMISYIPAYATGFACIAVTGLLDHVVLGVAMTRLKKQATVPEPLAGNPQ